MDDNDDEDDVDDEDEDDNRGCAFHSFFFFTAFLFALKKTFSIQKKISQPQHSYIN